MRARALFVGMFLVFTVASAAPASAKGAITEANISGPGLGGGSGSIGGGGGGGMKIEAPDTDRMWEAGVMEDHKSDSVAELGVPFAKLGPRYLVTYRFDFGPGARDARARQFLYPYAEGGPVTYTRPGQILSAEVFESPLTSGWFQAEASFLEFLVENGLPQTNPVPAAAEERPAAAPATQPVPATQSAPWGWILLGLAGLAALSLTAPGVRRRVLVAVTRMHH
jgi:hypothetical protein